MASQSGVSHRKDSKGNKDKSSKSEKDKSGSKSPLHESSSFFGRRSRSKKSQSFDPGELTTSPDSNVGLRGSTSSASQPYSPGGPMPSPKNFDHHNSQMSVQSSSASLDTLDVVPSIPERIKKGHVRILLPNKQRTMLHIKDGEAPLEDALGKAMRMRSLTPDNCLAYRLVPHKRVLAWKTSIQDVDGEEISVEDKFHTTFENPHRFVSKGQMALSYCDVCRKLMMAGMKCQTCGYKAHKYCKKNATEFCDMDSGSTTMPRNTAASLRQQILDSNDPLAGILYPSGGIGSDEEVEITRIGIEGVSSVYSKATERMKSDPPLKRLNHYGSAPSLHHDDGTMTSSTVDEPGTISHRTAATPGSITPEPPIEEVHTPTREPSPHSMMSSGISDMSAGASHTPKDRAFTESSTKSTRTANDSGIGCASDTSTAFGDSRGKSIENEVQWEISMDEVKIIKKVGSGAYGTVYKAEWHGEVAVKTLNVTVPTAELREVFANEVKVLLITRHTRVLLFMACILEPQLAIVTQWCEGSSLYQLLHVNDHKFEQEQNMTIGVQIAQGMGYLHSRRIIHRDLKSANVLLEHRAVSSSDKMFMDKMNQYINVKIADFGLSAFTGGTSAKKKQQPLGSLLWMAPEIITMKVANPYTEFSDVYAFGIIVFELITCSLPYPDVRNRDQLLFMIGMGTLRPDLEATRKKLGHVPRQFKMLFKKCVAFERDERPNFNHIEFELGNNLHGLPKVTRSSSLPSLKPML